MKALEKLQGIRLQFQTGIWDRCMYTESRITVIILADILWVSPLSWNIYKISAQLHVKQVENYSMKTASKEQIQDLL